MRILSFAAFALVAASTVATAGPGDWRRESRGSGLDTSLSSRLAARDRSREGRIEVSRFIAEGTAASLGHGSIAVVSGESDALEPPSDSPVFEAAVIDRLVRAGYDTASAGPATSSQVAELRLLRRTIEPAEQKRKPVSGAAEFGVGNRGTAYGLALAVDLSKPLPALVSTHLDARIRDRATGAVLWEGRAEVASREGDERWTDQDIAGRLADALFEGFPGNGDKVLAVR